MTHQKFLLRWIKTGAVHPIKADKSLRGLKEAARRAGREEQRDGDEEAFSSGGVTTRAEGACLFVLGCTWRREGGNDFDQRC